MANAVLTQEQRKEVAAKWVAGEHRQVIADEYGVCLNTIIRVCRDLHAVRMAPKPANAVDMKAFKKRVHSILYNQGAGKNRKQYDTFKERVAALTSGGGLKANEAVVRAAKEHSCLNQLFREYNVREHDPNPESHPQIQHFREVSDQGVECEQIQQTYRESLRWAAEAAGETARTGKRPMRCPCNTAWYLYKQAENDPKDFLAKLGQVESKGDAESEEKQNARLAGKRSIAEIDSFLAELAAEKEEDDDTG